MYIFSESRECINTLIIMVQRFSVFHIKPIFVDFLLVLIPLLFYKMVGHLLCMVCNLSSFVLKLVVHAWIIVLLWMICVLVVSQSQFMWRRCQVILRWCVRACMCVRVCRRAWMCVCVCACVHACVHACVRVYVCVCMCDVVLHIPAWFSFFSNLLQDVLLIAN